MLSIIAAIDKNGLMGNGNNMPWHIPSELKYFKELTTNKTIVMGRKTYESLNGPLKNRKNIIVTSNKGFKSTNDYIVYNDLYSLLYDFRESKEDAFFIGGANIFEQMIDIVDSMYITEIDHSFEGDVYFPEINQNKWNKELIKKEFVEEKLVLQGGHVLLKYYKYTRK